MVMTQKAQFAATETGFLHGRYESARVSQPRTGSLRHCLNWVIQNRPDSTASIHAPGVIVRSPGDFGNCSVSSAWLVVPHRVLPPWIGRGRSRELSGSPNQSVFLMRPAAVAGSNRCFHAVSTMDRRWCQTKRVSVGEAMVRVRSLPKVQLWQG